MSRKTEILDLLSLKRNELPLATKTIASLMQMDLSNCSKVLKKLAADGLITLTRRQEGRRRITYVSLPDKARPITSGQDQPPVASGIITTSGNAETNLDALEGAKTNFEKKALPVATTSGKSENTLNHPEAIDFEKKIPPVVIDSPGNLTTSGVETPVVKINPRTAEILKAEKPKTSKNRKAVTNFYIKQQILTAFEAFLQQFDKNIRITYDGGK